MGKVVILDNGHGGVIGGIYQTSGKRSPEWQNGTLYEGMFNRWVVNRIIEKLDRKGIPYYHVSPELTDTHLDTRVSRANIIYNENKDTWFLSIHANAGGGEGREAYTSVGTTDSDAIAEKLLVNLDKDLPEQKVRYDFTDGDRDKEMNFYVLRKTNCPAVLVECEFMDSKAGYDRLWDEDYLERLVCSLVKTIEELWREK